MSKYVMAMTYKPKIPGVFAGVIRQTTRKITVSKKTGKKREYKVGDIITFHTWDGKPYRSKWGLRMTVTLNDVWNVEFRSIGLYAFPTVHYWEDPIMDDFAKQDGIDPPTGRELKRVMRGESPNSPIKGQHDWEGEYQVLRW